MKEIRSAVFSFIALAVLTGVAYPTMVTVLAQSIFPHQANGSLLRSARGAPVGSALIGQSFSEPKYFWPRPSATADFPYNALASGGSNLGPTNRDLVRRVEARVKSFRESGIRGPLPADLVTASGSGLDAHLSPEAALMQVHRVATERKMDEERVTALVRAHIEGRQFGFLGAPRVNVLKLNLALDRM